MRALLLVPLAALLLVLFPACIECDETVTVYLNPEGALDFVAYLDDLRSDDKEDAARKKEEKELLADLKAGRFLRPALQKSGAKQVKTRLLRDTVPYAAVITGRYPDPVAFLRLFEYNEKEGGRTAQLTRDGAKRKLVLRFPMPAEAPAPRSRNDFPLRLKLVLLKGRFLAADGFRLESDGRTASPDEAALRERYAAAKPFELSLSW